MRLGFVRRHTLGFPLDLFHPTDPRIMLDGSDHIWQSVNVVPLGLEPPNAY